MTLLEALKAIAPAVGDGKIVRQNAYILYDGVGMLYATNGFMWANFRVSGPASGRFCVRHDMLLRALDHEGATLSVENQNVRVQCGRSRTLIKGIDPREWPTMPLQTFEAAVYLPDIFAKVLEDLSVFCGAPDGHTWQQGVHFREGIAFAANAFGAITTSWSAGVFSVPSWAVNFILMQDSGSPILTRSQSMLKFTWQDFSLSTTLLNEDPPDGHIDFLRALRPGQFQQMVPDNLRESVERVKAYGEKRFELGEGTLKRITDTVEIIDDVTVPTSVKVWGVDTMLDALKHAETIDLTGGNAVWEGGGYIGAFSGISR